MKKYLILLLLAGCAAPDYRYEVHLIDGGGTHHLITADTEDEAQDFVDEQEDSHGDMKVIKFNNH
jgi:hypothetical protein|tara:strand:- start:3547 stop:3741 length:195 start_codon:yes stop_codon:yes gene_type:complete